MIYQFVIGIYYIKYNIYIPYIMGRAPQNPDPEYPVGKSVWNNRDVVYHG